ncbi:CPBP family intramembrane metalloprotease [Planomonospora sp. ID91781]|uniref:CPBP family intramembrane glutamic endopeptidase n=1 Tax=Planomonospora sp. ID91781 TaxID=2738135 RepID=UPI0018C443E9|nr:CPBP family intramembrane glutamic endopeptidase [Planomonospora sp. ID91781]MBG0822615.1 CPBP family intramembrane metalloprotease [Planomonospora sp. ID91781]
MTTTLERPRGRRVLFAVVLTASSAVAAGVLTASTARTLAPHWSADLDRLAPVVVAAVYAAIAAALLVTVGRDRRARGLYLGLAPVRPSGYALGAAVWAAAYLAGAVGYLIAGWFGVPAGQVWQVLWAIGADDGRLADASPALAAVILVRACLLAPVAEELLFRGVLYGWLRARLPASWTITVTALGFGLIHQVPLFIPLAVAVGLAAGWIRERTGSTWVPIAVHVLQNVLVVLLSLALTGWHPAVSLAAQGP